MKKLIYSFAFVSILAFSATRVAKADYPEDCATKHLTCYYTRTQHTVVICDEEDLIAFYQILCN